MDEIEVRLSKDEAETLCNLLSNDYIFVGRPPFLIPQDVAYRLAWACQKLRKALVPPGDKGQ